MPAADSAPARPATAWRRRASSPAMKPPTRNWMSSMKLLELRLSRASVARLFPTVQQTSWSKSPSGTRTTRRSWTTKKIVRDFSKELGMPQKLDWDNLEDIAIGLTDKFPDLDPYTVRFTDMHKWITELPGFSGDLSKSNEGKLEAIQTAWH